MKKLFILTETGTKAEPKVGMNPLGLRTQGGQVRVERLIGQAREAGIEEIYVVAAYRKELYFYLEETYGIHLIDHQQRNLGSLYSLYLISDNLENAYVVGSWEYFEQNPFREDSKISYYLRDENQGLRDLIYVNSKTAKLLRPILAVGMEKSGFFLKEIKEFVIEYAAQFDVTEKKIKTLDDTVPENAFFLAEINQAIYRKISDVLQCDEQEIEHLQLVTAGNTNASFTFEVKGEKYIYRQPGASAGAFVIRESEVFAQKHAGELGLDDTAVYIDETGIKISRFVENVVPFKYENAEHRKLLFEKLRTLHDAGLKNEYDFDVLGEADRLFELAAEKRGNILERFRDIRREVHQLYEYTQADNVERVLCHNDMHAGNFMVSDNGREQRLYLIDWEFSRVGDPAYDFGCMVSYEDFSDEEIHTMLEEYFGRPYSFEEERHFLAYIAISGWYYMSWCQYKESQGEAPLFNMINRYHNVKRFLAKALPMYEAAEKQQREKRVS